MHQTWRNRSYFLRHCQKSTPQLSCHVSILGSPINNESKYEYLEITLDHNSKRTDQSLKVLKKVSQHIKLLKRVRSHLDSKTGATIYHKLIEPIMLNCTAIYLGIMLYHQKIVGVENIADMKKPFLSKLKERSAFEVFKYTGKRTFSVQRTKLFNELP